MTWLKVPSEIILASFTASFADRVIVKEVSKSFPIVILILERSLSLNISRMPAYDKNPRYMFFFVTYIFISVYLFMSIVLAVIFNNYHQHLKVWHLISGFIFLRTNRLKPMFKRTLYSEKNMNSLNVEYFLAMNIQNLDKN